MVHKLIILASAISCLASAQQEESQDVCSICLCYDAIITCRSLSLRSTLSEVAIWPANTKSLYLDFNEIGQITGFAPLPIKTLSLQYNDIVYIQPNAFSNFSDIEELNLSYNKLEYANLSTQVFKGPPSQNGTLNLLSLNLSHNNLRKLHPYIFEPLPRLQRLILANNPLANARGLMEKFTMEAISSARELKVLDLTSIGLSHLPNSLISTFPVLEELFLGGNQFQRLPVEALSYSYNLKVLNMNKNPIKLIASGENFHGLEKLSELHLSFMLDLTRIEDYSLATLTGLTYFYCQVNPKLKHISPTALNAPNLTLIDLIGNNLRHIPEALVSNWSSLTYIDLRYNPIACDCENRWIVQKLMHLSSMITNEEDDGFICFSPVEMLGRNLKDLSEGTECKHEVNDDGIDWRKVQYIIVAIVVVIVIVILIMSSSRRRTNSRRSRGWSLTLDSNSDNDCCGD